MRIGVCLVLLGLAWLAAFFLLERRDGALPSPVPPRGPAARTAGNAMEFDRPSRLQVDRSVAEGIAHELPLPNPADRDPPENAALEVHVVTPAGAACEGAQVTVWEVPHSEFAFLDSRFDRTLKRLAAGATDVLGVARLLAPRNETLVVEADAPGFAPSRESNVRAGTVVHLGLEYDAEITGRTIDAVTREPIANARVVVRNRSGATRRWSGRPVSTQSDSSGFYRLRGVAPGSLELDATHDRYDRDRAIELEVEAGARVVVEIALEAPQAIRGVVRDATTAAPIGGARITVPGHPGSIITRSDGTFEHADFPKYAYAVSASAAGYATVEQTLRGFPDGNLQVDAELFLPPERRARGVVVDLTGTPLADVYVAAAGSDYRGEQETQRVDWCSTTSKADGSFEIEGIHPDFESTLVLQRVGFATTLLDFPARADAVVEFGRIVLAPGARLEIEVVDETGAMRDDIEIALAGANADRTRLAPQREPNPLLDSYVATRRIRTDAVGLVRFRDVAAGSYRIDATIPGTHRVVSRTETIAPGIEAIRVRLEVPRGLGLKGRIKVSDEGAMPKVYVSVDPLDGQGTSGDAECDGNGRFEATGLAPGRYSLTVYPYPREEDARIGRRFDSVKIPEVILGLEVVEIVLPAHTEPAARENP